MNNILVLLRKNQIINKKLLCIFIMLFITPNNFPQIPQKYEYLFDSKKITEAMLWGNWSEDGTVVYLINYNEWPKERKEQLFNIINVYEMGLHFPIYKLELKEPIYGFDLEKGWLIYLTHIAHSFWLDANNKVSWKLQNYNSEELKYLLDCTRLFSYHPLYKLYCFIQSGQSVIDWNIQLTYDFMNIHNYIKDTQLETLYAFANWCRIYLRHGDLNNTPNPPLIEKILIPPEESNYHVAGGCSRTTGFFIAIMKSVNIPAESKFSVFSHPGDNIDQYHLRVEFPSLNRGLGHSDDIYSSYNVPLTGNYVPSDKIFVTKNWLTNYIDDPIHLDSDTSYINTKRQQALFNNIKHSISISVDNLTDYWLQLRINSVYMNKEYLLNNELKGIGVNDTFLTFANPFYTETEQDTIITEIDKKIRELGGGDWNIGANTVLSRYLMPIEKDIYLPKPTICKLVKPLVSDTINTFNPQLIWNKPTNAFSSNLPLYTVQIDISNAFNNPLEFTDVADTTYVLEKKLGVDTTYFWRVLAKNFGGTSSWSETGNFIVSDANGIISIEYPTGGEIFPIGSNPQIRYASNGASGFVNIDYSTDGGITWDTIATNVLDDGTWNDWIIPNTPSSNCKIRISDVDDSPSTISTGLFTISYVVPVELISFTADVKENGILLTWKTASEINNTGFEIQKKIDGLWEKIGHVNGSGTSLILKEYAFLDRSNDNLNRGIISYRLKQIDYNGTYNFSNSVIVEIDFLPKEYILKQNYPNPFNPNTRINFSIPMPGIVRLIVYDIIGNEVATLVSEEKPAGIYEVQFDGSNLSSGIYFYRMQAGDFIDTKKFILLK